MKVYISGAITSIGEEKAKMLFDDAKRMLLNEGHIPVSPMDLPHKHTGTWKEYMKEDIVALMDCDAIYMLPNWPQSKGAMIEKNIAFSLGISELKLIVA